MEECLFTLVSDEHKQELTDYRREFIEAGSSMDGTGALGRLEDPEEYLRHVRLMADPATVPPHLVQADQYACVRKSDGRILGMLQIRYRLNDHLLNFGGHIGYSVRPSERRKGVAGWMLTQALDRMRSLGYDKALVTCLTTNEASRRTILSHGGVYEDTRLEQETGNALERYWITLL